MTRPVVHLDFQLFKHFLPPRYEPATNPPYRQLVKQPAGSDSDPDRITERDRAINQHGRNLLNRIRTDYKEHIIDLKWKPAFTEVIAAFASAVGERERTVKRAQEERERDAAISAFVFSVLTAGVMKFVGVWLEHAVLPGWKRLVEETQKGTTSVGGRWFPWTGRDGVTRNNIWDGVRFFDDTTHRIQTKVNLFTAKQAALFGGLVEEVGKEIIPLAFPKPKPVTYQLDSMDGVFNMQADFITMLSDSAAVVLGQFDKVLKWLDDSTQFGAAWAEHADGKAELARVQIKRHFEKLREGWAKEWEFFGKEPNKIVRPLLALEYERSLWASSLLPVLNKATVVEGSDGEGALMDGKLVEKAIVDRLKQLNVVRAETIKGTAEQVQRKLEGAPDPEATVYGSVNEFFEWRSLKNWAESYLKRAPGEFERRFFPPAQKRVLPPL